MPTTVSVKEDNLELVSQIKTSGLQTILESIYTSEKESKNN